MKSDLFTLGVPFVAGGIVFLLAGFGSGLVTTSSDARLSAQNARDDARANICEKAATAHFAEIGEKMPDFEGMTGRDERKALAADFLVSSGDEKIDRLALESCSEKLASI
jgi:hypothetical protein